MLAPAFRKNSGLNAMIIDDSRTRPKVSYVMDLVPSGNVVVMMKIPSLSLGYLFRDLFVGVGEQGVPRPEGEGDTHGYSLQGNAIGCPPDTKTLMGLVMGSFPFISVWESRPPMPKSMKKPKLFG